MEETCSKSPKCPNAAALQVLNERCTLLQNRVDALEKENVQLTVRCADSVRVSDPDVDTVATVATIARLNKEKAQLAHHIFALSYENKRLWSTLTSGESGSAYGVPALARSHTFTHPRPPRRISKVEGDSDDVRNSLEEISLKLINSFLLEKSELVNQYEQMVEMQLTDDPAGQSRTDDPAVRPLIHLRKQLRKVNETKRLATQQQIHLKKLLNALHSKKTEKQPCPSCAESKNLTGEAPKEIISSTDTSNAESPKMNKPEPRRYVKRNEATSKEETSFRNSNATRTDPAVRQNHTPAKDDSQKNGADIKICPMCGKVYMQISFNEFEHHVESHFVADDDYDSIQENFEVVTSSVGNNFN